MDGNELRLLQAPLKKRYREQPETERTPARAEAVLKASSLLPGTEGSNPVPSRRESRANLKTTLLGRGIAGLEAPAPAGITEILRTSRAAIALVEYGMLVGLIAVICVVAVTTLGTEVSTAFSTIASALSGI